MRAIALQSGSSGNCIYIESNGTGLVIDAGISGRQAEERLMAHGVEIRSASALLISHDHSDHARSAGVFHRKFGLPLCMTPKTREAAERSCGLGELKGVEYFRAGERIVIGSLTVETLATPHDGADGAVFVIDDGTHRIGVLTDLGHVFPALPELVGSLHGVFLESNYDPRMLETGPYPAFLKKRIRGPHGHISNAESAGVLASFGSRLRWACLSHLSEQNNHPDLARAAHRDALGPEYPLHCASRSKAMDAMLTL
jgi:phosphoribosyl 1,2-cyclic phosphodiesterase